MAKAAKRAERKHPPEDENRRQRFERIMTARMNRVLNSIRLLGNLASPAYDYSEQDVAVVKQAIEEQLTKSMGRFERSRRGERTTFTLPKVEA